jgi:4-hydroxy-3-methylbut-2-enyl diphosphate reductase
MKIIRAEVLGYCLGVRRAVELAWTEAVRAETARSARRVYTMGPLIHNPQVVEDLRRHGVEVLDCRGEAALPEDLSDAVVIIRAHGITPQLEASLARRGAAIVDATCPKVKASQMKARSLSAAAYRIFLAGEKDHGEIIGIQGYAPDCVIVANREEAAAAAETLFRELSAGKGEPAAPRIALLAQTTLSPEEYRDIAEGIARFFPALERIDTICPATRDRQDALKALCAKVDAVIIAGGRESANTRRLLTIAESSGKPAWLVENARALPPGLGSCQTIGLSAGASAPDEAVGAIEEALLRP